MGKAKRLDLLIINPAQEWTSRLNTLSLRLSWESSADTSDAEFADLASRSRGILCGVEDIPARSGRQKLPIIAWCRDASETDRALALGASEVVVEPVSDALLSHVLRRALHSPPAAGEHSDMKQENARLRQELDDVRRISSALRAITSSLDIGEVLTNILDVLRHLFGLQRVVLGMIHLDESPREEIKLALGGGVADCRGSAWPIQNADPLWTRLRSSRDPVFIAADDAAVPDVLRQIFPKGFLKFPLVVKGEVLGTIMCARPEGQDLELLGTLCEYAAVAIQNGRLYFDIIRSEDQLKEAHQKLVEAEKMALIGQMAISINHEINNPLCNISLIAQTVADRIAPAEPSVLQLLNGVDENVQRILEVTRKLTGLRNATLTEYLPNQMMVDLG